MSVHGIQNYMVHQSPQEIHGIQKQGPVPAPAAPDEKPSIRSERPAYDEYIPGGEPEAAPSKSGPGRKAETCTTNTDEVDREIEKLKDKKEQLEQQLRTAEDPEKAEELERRLAQVEHELRQKDNDAYRRQNAVVS